MYDGAENLKPPQDSSVKSGEQIRRNRRRERIAATILGGLFAAVDRMDSKITHEEIVDLAIKYTDILIARLDKTPP